jgi:formate--tetrahydrofolate ligase
VRAEQAFARRDGVLAREAGPEVFKFSDIPKGRALSAAEVDGYARRLLAEMTLEEKISRVAQEIYGAAGVHFESDCRKRLAQYTAMGFGKLPVCMAKTQSSLSDNPKLLGAPTGFTLTVSDVHLSAGAGFVVVIAGNMLRMPGLGKTPQAVRMDVNEKGEIVGLS